MHKMWQNAEIRRKTLTYNDLYCWDLDLNIRRNASDFLFEILFEQINYIKFIITKQDCMSIVFSSLSYCCINGIESYGNQSSP